MRFSFRTSQSTHTGFSLVELLISLGLFMVVITISLGSVVSVLDAGRKARSLKSVMTNLNFALESISRDVKFGTLYFCGTDAANPHAARQDCTGEAVEPRTSLTFTKNNGTTVIYRLNAGRIEQSSDFGVSYSALTAPEVVISDLKFYVFGTTAYPPDTEHPRVLMRVSGYAGSKPTLQSKFYLQTVVSQRAIDNN